MRAVETLGVDPVELAHACGQIGLGSFEQQVVMVAHLAPGVAHPVEASADLPQHFQPGFAIGIPQIDILPPVATRGVNRPGF